MTDESPAVDEQVQIFLASIRSGNAEGIITAFNRVEELQGTASASTIIAALDASGLTKAMLAALTKRAQDLHTATAWSDLAMAAATVGDDGRAVEAAQSALQIDPAMARATFFLSVAANRAGNHETALRAIMDLVSQVPAAKDDPLFILQTAQAELGLKQPMAALARIDAGLPTLIAASWGFDAQMLRARIIDVMPERSAEAVSAWERTLAAALHPVQVDLARDNLIAALIRAKRYDECLREIDKGLAATTNAEARAAWLEVRLNVLAAKGDFDGAIAACEDRLAITTDPGQRLQLRLRQARIAALASRWKEAATRFDAALAEIAPDATDASERRREVLLQKAGTLVPHDIDSVLSNLDELDVTWASPGWPVPIDMRMEGLLAAGRAGEALVWLEQRINRTPALADHPAAHYLRGAAELKLNHADEAKPCFARAIELAPAAADPRAWGAALVSAYATQQWKAAINAYDRLIEINPPSALDANVNVFAAMAYLRVGNLERALNLTDNAAPTAPQLLAVREITRGEAQFRLKRYDDALATTDAALKRYQAGQSTEGTAEFLVSLHALRAQVFNALEKFEAARDEATKAIEVPDDPGVTIEGLAAFVRIGARIQRSLALYKLNATPKEAHQDVDEAIASFDQLRNSTVVKVLGQGTEFEQFETSLWFAKGALLQSESRSEEALAAYSRAERLEKHGNMAAVAQGYALVLTGDFKKALNAFERAIVRASCPKEHADALDGKGRAFVRLRQFDEAIAALHDGLDARLMEPGNDPGVFELLGIAYDALERTGAAARAYRRAWMLTKENDRSANLARGVTAAELGLGDPAAALKFLDDLPSRLKDDRTLLFNRALALDALGRRPAAIGCFVQARDAGLDRAQRELDRRDAPAGLGRWTHYWFGPQARRNRRTWGIVLLVIAATGLAAPLFQWLLHGKCDWYLLLLPSVVALVLLALPNIKSISGKVAGVEITAEPMSATGQDAAAVTAPESFTVPTLVAVTLSATESKPAAV